jgi:hypothetical protein
MLTLSLPTACPELCSKYPFSTFTMPVYLVYRGEWPDLACGSPGVWAPLQFQFLSPSVFVRIK